MECYFCRNNIKEIDFRNTRLLSNFITGLGKIRSQKVTGLCGKHQRQVSRTIKRARSLGLLSPTTKEF